MKFKADNAYYLKDYDAARKIALQAVASKTILHDKVRHRDWLDLLAHCYLHTGVLDQALECMQAKVSWVADSIAWVSAVYHTHCFDLD